MSSIGFSLSQQYDFGYQVISDRKETLGTVDLKDTKKMIYKSISPSHYMNLYLI